MDGRAGVVFRKLKGLQPPAQLPFPVEEQRLQLLLRQPALPLAIVRVLHRKLWQPRGAPADPGHVYLRQLLGDEPQRPFVRDDVVNRYRQYRLLRIHPEEHSTHQQVAPQCERLPRLVKCTLHHPISRRRPRAAREIHHLQL